MTRAKDTNGEQTKEELERHCAALSLSIPNITSMHLNLGSIQLPLNAATKTFAKISLCLRVCAPVLCSL